MARRSSQEADGSSYELTLGSHMNLSDASDNKQEMKYKELYSKPAQRLSNFENFLKGRLITKSYMQEEVHFQPNIRSQNFIGQRRKDLPPYQKNIDFKKNKFEDQGSTYDVNGSRQQLEKVEVNEGDSITTPRGILDTFLRSDVKRKLTQITEAEESPQKRIDVQKFFYKRNFLQKLNKNDLPNQTKNTNEDIVLHQTNTNMTQEDISNAHKANDSTMIQQQSQQQQQQQQRSISVDQSIQSSFIQPRAPSAEGRRKQNLLAPQRPNSRVASAKSNRSRGSAKKGSEGMGMSQFLNQTQLPSANMSSLGEEDDDESVGNKSFIIPSIREGNRSASKNYGVMSSQEKQKAVKEKINQFMKQKNQPIFKDKREKEIYEKLESDEQKRYFENYRQRLKTFQPKKRNIRADIAEEVNKRRKDSLLSQSAIETVIPVSQAQQKEVSALMIQKDNFPDWIKYNREFQTDYANRANKAQQIVASICDRKADDRSSDDLTIVSSWLEKTRLFRALPKPTLKSLAARLTYRKYLANEVLCRQEEPGDCLYIIYDGLVRCLRNENEVAQYKTYDTPGQAALDSHVTKRTATLIAAVDTEILRLEREDYRDIMEHYINMEKTQFANFLKDVKILKEMSEKKMKMLAAALQSKHYSKGDIIYKEGESAESFYILKQGEIQIECTITIDKENLWPTSTSEWKKNKVRRIMKFTDAIHPGQYFGEVELLKPSKRLHKVVCLKHSYVLILNKREFTKLLDLEDIQKMKHALHDNILEDPEVMKKKLLEQELEKRQLRDAVQSALRKYMAGIQLGQLEKIDNKVQQPTQQNVREQFNSFMRNYTIRTVVTNEDIQNKGQYI